MENTLESADTAFVFIGTATKSRLWSSDFKPQARALILKKCECVFCASALLVQESDRTFVSMTKQ